VCFGEFLRLGGEWNGQQLLPTGFVDYMRSHCPGVRCGQGPVLVVDGFGWLIALGFDLPADTFMLAGHPRQVIAIISVAQIGDLPHGDDAGGYWLQQRRTAARYSGRRVLTPAPNFYARYAARLSTDFGLGSNAPTRGKMHAGCFP
jgi:hypothetical protein